MGKMYGAKSTYTKSQRPHGNTTLGLEGKPTKRINKTAVRPSIEPRSNTAWQHHLNNEGGLEEEEEGRAGAGRELLLWSHFSHFFTFFFNFFALPIYACSLFHFFHFFAHFFHCFHSCVFVVLSRFWLKTASFPDSAPLLGENEK